MEIDLEACQQLRDYLDELPDREFHYGSFFADKDDADWRTEESAWSAFWNDPEKYPCGTVACAAGHACILFELQGRHGGGSHTPDIVAGVRLGLDEGDRYSLFQACCWEANREAAIARLDYLIKHQTLTGYCFATEPARCGY